MRRLAVLTLPLALAVLAGCDMLGIESPEKVAAAREAEGRAVGAACRHAGRALEDCYALNKRVDKAALFAGWRDMNDYMRENKIAEVPPQVPAAAEKGAKASKHAEGEDEEETEEKPAPKKAAQGSPQGWLKPVEGGRRAAEGR